MTEFGLTPLHRVRTYEEALRLIENGADVNAQDYDLCTPLHLVQDPMIAFLLLENGADPDAKDYLDSTPLHYATNSTLIIYLLKFKANPKIQNMSGTFALDEKKYEKIREILKKFY